MYCVRFLFFFFLKFGKVMGKKNVFNFGVFVINYFFFGFIVSWGITILPFPIKKKLKQFHCSYVYVLCAFAHLSKKVLNTLLRMHYRTPFFPPSPLPGCIPIMLEATPTEEALNGIQQHFLHWFWTRQDCALFFGCIYCLQVWTQDWKFEPE